jgi:parallel beta-helix repeat protein
LLQKRESSDYQNCTRNAVARFVATGIGLGALLIAATGQPAAAATFCVNTGGSAGCKSTIGAAVAAAAAGDTIQVAHGTYKEDVMITKSLSLVGDNDANTIIDATGKVNGITIMDTKAVSVSGFTVENAQAAGIWITGSSFVTIFNNRVINNDRALIPGANASCPPLKGTPFEAGEAEDCGEGVFLSAVDHSILSGNLITGNAGGILITDDTGPTHDNLISGNSVVRNTALDCGITLPSHSTGGVYHNTVSGNDSSYNGGPGVGIFAPGPGSKAYGNVVINNHLRGNGLPGVTMHNHAAPGVNGVPPGAPPPNFNDNVIVGNDISANAADTEDAATGGTTGINIYSVGPMTGTIISQNVIYQQMFDIVIKVPASGGVPTALVHLNDLQDNNRVGLQNAGTAPVDATQNWWGCSGGPKAHGCATISGNGVLFAPWLTRPFQAGGDN